jgi:hypothetical protein
MSWTLTDFPPWRESGGPLQALPLLAQHLVLAPQPPQLGRHVLLAIGRGLIHRSTAPRAAPVAQRRQPGPETLSDLAPGAATGLDQAHRLVAERLG